MKRTAAQILREKAEARRNGHARQRPPHPEYPGDPEPSEEEMGARAWPADAAPSPTCAAAPMPWRPFPIEALPEPLGSFTKETADALGCDPAMVALPGLACYASLIGNSRALALKGSWPVPCALWTCVVAESGTLKSPALDKAIDPVWVIQHDLFTQHAEEAKFFRQRGGNGPEPVARRTITNDVTVEKLAELLHDNSRGLLVARDELAGWIGSFTKYKSAGAGTDLPNWLTMHRASPLAVDRKTGDRPTIIVSRALVSVTGTIQPEILNRLLTQEHDQAGLTPRLLVAMPPRQLKRWTEADIPDDVRREHEETCKALFKLTPLACEEGDCKPQQLHLTTEAKARWVGWYDRWAQEQFAAEGSRAARLAKLEEAAPRLALVHHVASEVYGGREGLQPVGLESLEAGIRQAEWFAYEGERLAARREESTTEKDQRELLELIARQPGHAITARGLQKANRRRYPSSDAAEQAMNGLVHAGLASWRDRPPSPGGGRPTREVVLNSPGDNTPKPETPPG